MIRRRLACRRRVRATTAWLLTVAFLLPSVASAESPRKTPGYVDGSVFVDLAGDESVAIEVSIKGPLIRAISKADKELEQLLGGLESIHAVILEIDDARRAEKVAVQMRETERELLGRGWERMARYREPDADIRILVLNDEETIEGLVVMVSDRDENQMVFANIAGTLDLAAIAAIGESLDIPGLDDLDLGNGGDDDDEDD